MKEIKEIVKKHIEDCMRSFVNNATERENIHQRLDELLLLWDNIEGQSFVKTCEEFGITYKFFDEKHYNLIAIDIAKHLKMWEDYE